MTIFQTLLRWASPFLILGAGIGVFLALGKQESPPRATVAAVEAVPVETAAVRLEEKGIDIVTDGVVVPIREVTLAAEVGGKIIMKSPSCESGEYVKEGTLLLQIDPRDYELDVERLQRELKQASLAIEEVDEEEFDCHHIDAKKLHLRVLYFFLDISDAILSILLENKSFEFMFLFVKVWAQ